MDTEQDVAGRRVRRGWILKLKSGMSLFTCIWTYRPLIYLPVNPDLPECHHRCNTFERKLDFLGNPGKPWELRGTNLALLWLRAEAALVNRTHRPIFQRNQNVFHPWGVERLDVFESSWGRLNTSITSFERLSPIICKVSLPVLSKLEAPPCPKCGSRPGKTVFSDLFFASIGRQNIPVLAKTGKRISSVWIHFHATLQSQTEVFFISFVTTNAKWY